MSFQGLIGLPSVASSKSIVIRYMEESLLALGPATFRIWISLSSIHCRIFSAACVRLIYPYLYGCRVYDACQPGIPLKPIPLSAGLEIRSVCRRNQGCSALSLPSIPRLASPGDGIARGGFHLRLFVPLGTHPPYGMLCLMAKSRAALGQNIDP